MKKLRFSITGLVGRNPWMFKVHFLSFFFLIYFCLHWVFIGAWRLSLVSASRGYSLVAVCVFLISVASRCRAWVLGGRGFSDRGTRALVAVAHGLWSTGSVVVVVVHRLRCSTAGGIFLDQGSNCHPSRYKIDS